MEEIIKFESNKLDEQYQNLLKCILDTGYDKSDRTGTGTKSVFNYQIVHNMEYGFPLLTTKKMAWKSIVTELLWFLRGDTNIKYLVDNDCHIWDGDCFSNYQKITKREIELNTVMETHPHYGLSKEDFINKIKTDGEFAKNWGDLGPIYGEQWRRCTGLYINGEYEVIDQIANLIKDLKKNPDSRRLIVSAWNVAELDAMTLPPCHYNFQVYTRELNLDQRVFLYMRSKGLQRPPKEITLSQLKKAHIPTRALSLMWNQRSVDTFLGLPFNIASYGLLLTILAKEVNMHPEWLFGSLGDTHLYNNHIEAAQEQISREPKKLPKLIIKDKVNRIKGECLPNYTLEDFILEDYDPHPAIKAPLSN